MARPPTPVEVSFTLSVLLVVAVSRLDVDTVALTVTT
jgi:hypothetical protein